VKEIWLSSRLKEYELSRESNGPQYSFGLQNLTAMAHEKIPPEIDRLAQVGQAWKKRGAKVNFKHLEVESSGRRVFSTAQPGGITNRWGQSRPRATYLGLQNQIFLDGAVDETGPPTLYIPTSYDWEVWEISDQDFRSYHRGSADKTA